MITARARCCRWSIRRIDGRTCLTLHQRLLTTIAIESSCDDTSVAIVEKQSRHQNPISTSRPLAKIHFHEKVTSNNLVYQGVHPLVALDSHQRNLALLVQRAIKSIPDGHDGRQALIDFVTVTRGPGMRSNLSVGLDTAKGLAVAWDVPLLAVNHMHAHALTPRLVSALESSESVKPAFPFLSLLVSGGHTLLLHSRSLCDHSILAETLDIAIGEAIDKIARAVLPQDILETSQNAMYGPALEQFVFGTGKSFDYIAPSSRREELEVRRTGWSWALTPPLSKLGSDGIGSKTMAYSFTGTMTRVLAIVEERSKLGMGVDERQDLGKEAMRVMFEHLASRVVLGLKAMPIAEVDSMQALVISGGVAANLFLREIVQKFLAIRGYGHITVMFPPLELCTDNAAMIGWTGIEMFEQGWRSELTVQPLRKWSLDGNPGSQTGIIGAGGWKQIES